jgi:uncharacterized protein (DUF2249 family)/antitoxin (DNA-binding transcriptional repressor) of toxin-antitoxin stability system
VAEVSLMLSRGGKAGADEVARSRLDGAARSRPLTLAEEHMLLLRQVRARAEELVAAVAAGRWPGAELAALAGYAQAEVLRQVSEEEALLFPGAPAPQATGLARDHVRLRYAAELLERAAAGEQSIYPGTLAAVARDFVTQLERHLRSEESQLASLRAPSDLPGTAALGGHPHDWYPLTEGAVVDLDALPAGQEVAAAIDRLLRLRLGEQIELQASMDLEPVWRETSRLSPDSYQFVSLQDGPDRWRMQVSRRRLAI